MDLIQFTKKLTATELSCNFIFVGTHNRILHLGKRFTLEFDQKHYNARIDNHGRLRRCNEHFFHLDSNFKLGEKIAIERNGNVYVLFKQHE